MGYSFANCLDHLLIPYILNRKPSGSILEQPPDKHPLLQPLDFLLVPGFICTRDGHRWNVLYFREFLSCVPHTVSILFLLLFCCILIIIFSIHFFYLFLFSVLFLSLKKKKIFLWSSCSECFPFQHLINSFVMYLHQTF